MKVAVIQDAGVSFDPEAALATVAKRMAAAAAVQASLAVFPEAFIGGYPKGADFGTRVGQRTPEGRQEFARYARGAIEVPGPEARELGELARRHQLHTVIGVVERDQGTLYCTALCLSDQGALLGKHRKVMPTAMERLIWGFGDGSTLRAWPTALGKIGAAICWENYMPLLRFSLYAQGVELYCAPTVDDRETWIPTMRHVAMEGRCFVLSACQFIPPLPSAPGIRGGSCIVGPLGQLLAGPVYEQQCLVTAELDLAEVTQGKLDLDVAGHYARPDLFQLRVNQDPMPPMRWDSPGN